MPTINKNKIKPKQIPYRHESRDISSKYYNSKQWKNLRNYYIRRNPLCEICLSKGIVKAAEEVHHIKFILGGKTEEERWERLTDENNLMSLCISCHHEIHNKRRTHK